MFLLEVEKVLFIVFLERTLDLFVFWEGFMILWITRELGQTLVGQRAERISLDCGDCCILVLQFLSTIVE